MSDKPHLQFHQTLPGLSDKPHLIFFQTLHELSDKVHSQFHQTLPKLSDKPRLIFFQTLHELPDKVHLPFFQAPHELPDKVHLIFFQTLPESRTGLTWKSERSEQLCILPSPSLRIQPKKQSAFRRRKWKKSPTLSRWNYFTNRNAVSKYFLMQYSLLPFLIRRCSAPPFCFLQMPRPFTRLHCHPSAVPQFFTFLSPLPISLFTCLRNRIPLSVFMLSCCRKVSKQCVWKHKNIHI